jgi:hypothetical protein
MKAYTHKRRCTHTCMQADTRMSMSRTWVHAPVHNRKLEQGHAQTHTHTLVLTHPHTHGWSRGAVCGVSLSLAPVARAPLGLAGGPTRWHPAPVSLSHQETGNPEITAECLHLVSVCDREREREIQKESGWGQIAGGR